MLTAAKNAQLL